MNAVIRSRFTGVLSAAGAALALALCGGAAGAQTHDETILPRKWAIKLGGFLSNNGGMKGQAGDLWWYGGLDYFPNFRYRPLNGDVHFGLDARWRSSGLGDFHTIDASAKIIWPITQANSPTGMHVWGGAGIGIYFINTAFIGNTTQVGGKFILGIDLTSRLFVEVDYDYVSGFSDSLGNGLRADGVTFALGHRF